MGVLVLVLSALNKAFSAPKIWTVEAGYFERLLKDPEWEISLAPTFYPTNVVKLGATCYILSFKYPWISVLNW